ncbi:hypothetical protein [Mucilaginibacter gotjawali]|uniref:Uncharacterized protein n=1 Tax=Mucilaginibacter gotjawali TaxID=1550579 RepID=A0A839SI54_9SPHI|nr:hypothetical protein [Mucilaginibacter gotjawali]MBB3057052.1 hypothetical protein [Mucilaginibacter gotjawali]
MITLYLVFPGAALAQTTFEDALQKKTDSLLAPVKAENTRDELLPNNVLQNLISPSGWGGFGTYIFGGIGGDYPQPYRTRADLIAFGGFCTGNPQKAVNVALSMNITNVHEVTDLSGNIQISRQIFTGSSISAGGLQLFANKRQSDSPGSTFYFAFSHALQWLPSATPGSSKLTYTIGIGNGRFYTKSALDIKNGRGRHGTAIFGSISYELIKNVNFNTEWSGINLGCSLGIKPFNSPLAVGIGVTDLTRYASDKINSTFLICYPLSVAR